MPLNRKIRIMFVIPDMTGGGAERILLQIMKRLDRERFEGSVALFEQSGKFLGEIPPDMPVTGLGEKRHYRFEILRIAAKLRRLAKAQNPDIVFSVINVANFVAIPAAKLAGAKAVAYEMSHPYSDIKMEHRFPMISSTLLKATYRFADIALALSKGIGESLVNDFGVNPEKVKVSYTPFDMELIKDKAKEEVDHQWLAERRDIPVIAGAGALYKNKGFDVLIKAAAHVSKKLPLRVIILGEGPERENLLSLASELGIADSVYLAGFQHNPWKFIGRADVFALPSLHEGFGNVIVEAMILGVPVVASDCPVGPREILLGGDAGLLVKPGDHEDLAEAILKLTSDKPLREKLANKASERVVEFDQAHVMKKLEALLVSLT